MDVDEDRKKFQLHFVGYIFVVSGTSSSTKVRMTTDSSMRSESGLSLNDVTKPAPGDVHSLRGILLRSRCHNFYAIYDIKKFFRSVPNSDSEIKLIKCEIDKILSKGGFSIKSWECSGEDGSSKYLGMTWSRKDDRYLLKFHLNLYKKFRGIPSGADLDEDGAAGVVVPGPVDSSGESNPGTQRAEVLDEVSST